MAHVFLVRHGQASAGTSNYDRLSDIGIQQAKLLSEHWQQQDSRIDAAFSGTLERQQHTAELALSGKKSSPEVETLEGLNEYDHGTIDKLYGEGIQSDGGTSLKFNQYVDIMARWRDAPKHHKTQAQSWQDFSMQGWQAIRDTVESYSKRSDASAEKHANLVFFTSGGVIATVLAQALSLEFEPTMHALWQTRNSSITNFLFNRHGVCLVDYNTVTHLHTQQDSSLITQI